VIPDQIFIRTTARYQPVCKTDTEARLQCCKILEFNFTSAKPD